MTGVPVTTTPGDGGLSPFGFLIVVAILTLITVALVRFIRPRWHAFEVATRAPRRTVVADIKALAPAKLREARRVDRAQREYEQKMREFHDEWERGEYP